VKNSVVYVALGIDITGKQDVLAETESASFWANVCMDLKARGVVDILISCADGLTGLPDAITAVFPKTDVQFIKYETVLDSSIIKIEKLSVLI
jgi:putative transposase